jgi:cell division protein FtsN
VAPRTNQPPPAPQAAPKAFTPFATPKPQQQVAAAKPYTQPATDEPAKPQVATKPPAQLGGAHPATVPPAAAPKTAAAPAPLKPATMKPVDTPAKPAASGSYLLQVGAFKSDAEARTAWKAYQSKHAALLNGFGPDVQKVDLGDKGTWYRLRIASFADKDAAAAVCDRLKAQGGSCFLAK